MPRVPPWFCCICKKNHSDSSFKQEPLRLKVVNSSLGTFKYQVGKRDTYLKKTPTLDIPERCKASKHFQSPDSDKDGNTVGYVCGKYQSQQRSTTHAARERKESSRSDREAVLEGKLFLARSDAAAAQQSAEAAMAEAVELSDQVMNMLMELQRVAPVARLTEEASQAAAFYKQSSDNSQLHLYVVTEALQRATNEAAESKQQLDAAASARDDVVSKLVAAEEDLASKEQQLLEAHRRQRDTQRQLTNLRVDHVATRSGIGPDVRQQRTLTGGVRSGIDGPETLYRVLGLRKDSSGAPIPAGLYKTNFTRGLGSYGERRARTLMQSLDHVMDSILDVYEKSPELKDEVFRAYVAYREANCPGAKAFRMAIACKIPVVQDAVDMYNASTDPDERCQILSTLTSTFDRHGLNMLGFDKAISKHALQKARSHASAFGPGGQKWDHLKQVHRTRLDRSIYEGCLHEICDPANMQEVAFGHRDLRLSSGVVIKIPAVQRKTLQEIMWREYRARNTTFTEDADGKVSETYSGVGRSKFFQMTKATTAGQQKSLSGLDNISFRYGQENFATLRKECEHLLGSAKAHQVNLEMFGRLGQRIETYQQFLKRDMLDHLQPHSPVADHCLCRLLGGQPADFDCPDCAGRRANNRIRADNKTCPACIDRAAHCQDCPASCGQHEEHCELCDQGQIIFAEMFKMLELLEAHQSVPREFIEDRRFVISRCQHRLRLYIAHLVRGSVEASAKAARRQGLGPHQVEITMDYKMKWVALLLRECQLEWFGKAGISWHGAMFLRRLVPDDATTEVDLDELCIEYYDDLSDDKKEDGFSVLSSLEADLDTFTATNPDVDEGYLATDGAGVYAGKFLAHCLPYLSQWYGIKILDHSIGEAGMNKSSLDGHFGTAGPHVKQVVASGQSNAVNALDVVRCMHLSGGITGTTCRQIILDRRGHQKQLKTSVLTNVAIRSMAYRKFEYLPSRVSELHEDSSLPRDRWVGVRFFKHAMCGAGQFVSRATLEANWESEPQGPTGVKIKKLVPLDGTSPGFREKLKLVVPTGDVDHADSVVGDVRHGTPGTGDASSEDPLVQTVVKRKSAAPEAGRAKRQMQAQERARLDAEKLSALEGTSDGYWCRTPGCTRFCRSKVWRDYHTGGPRCPDAGTNPFRCSLHKLKSGKKVVTPPFISASDMVKLVAGAPNSRLRQLVKRDAAAEGSAASELRVFLSGCEDFEEPVQMAPEKERDDESPEQRAERECAERARAAEVQRAADCMAGRYRLSDGSQFLCPVVPVGASMKGGAGSRFVDKKTPAQLEFLDWAYARGVDCKGAKLTARDAEHAMTMMGTTFGFHEYGCNRTDGCLCPSLMGEVSNRSSCIWKPQQNDQSKFRAAECMEHWTFRTWFSGQKAQIVAKLKRAMRDNASTSVEDLALIATLDDGSCDLDV